MKEKKSPKRIKISKKKAILLPKKNESALKYNSFKIFAGQQYTGMKVGGHHKWYYNKGEWKEVKRTPDVWEFSYNVSKKRAGKAPKGSGVPVGTEYQWGILSLQNVKKLDENTYSTEMKGVKFKVAHKRVDKEKWNISENAQRNRFIKFLEFLIVNMQQEGNEKKEIEMPTRKKENKKNLPQPARDRAIIPPKERTAAKKLKNTKTAVTDIRRVNGRSTAGKRKK